MSGKISINITQKTYHVSDFVFDGEKQFDYVDIMHILGADDYTDLLETGEHKDTQERLRSNGFFEIDPLDQFIIEQFDNGRITKIPFDFIMKLENQPEFPIVKFLEKACNLPLNVRVHLVKSVFPKMRQEDHFIFVNDAKTVELVAVKHTNYVYVFYRNLR